MSELDTLINKVHCMDALELMARLPDNSVDAVITDPPYGTGTQVSARRSPAERFDEIEGVDEINSDWIPEAYRALKPTGAMYVFAKWRNVGKWQDIIERCGFDVRNMLVWDKGQHGTGDLGGAYAPRHELCLFCAMPEHKLQAPRRADVIRIPKVNPSDLIHPYQKPVDLLKVFILASTHCDGLVVDPFAGSGTTAVAAATLNRRFIVGDTNEGYCAIARKRLETVTQDMFEVYGGFKSETQS